MSAPESEPTASQGQPTPLPTEPPAERKASKPRARLEEALVEIKRVIAGQDEMLERVLVCLVAGGHLLIEGVPGLAKTLTIKTTAAVLGGTRLPVICSSAAQTSVPFRSFSGTCSCPPRSDIPTSTPRSCWRSTGRRIRERSTRSKSDLRFSVERTLQRARPRRLKPPLYAESKSGQLGDRRRTRRASPEQPSAERWRHAGRVETRSRAP